MSNVGGSPGDLLVDWGVSLVSESDNVGFCGPANKEQVSVYDGTTTLKAYAESGEGEQVTVSVD